MIEDGIVGVIDEITVDGVFIKSKSEDVEDCKVGDTAYIFNSISGCTQVKYRQLIKAYSMLEDKFDSVIKDKDIAIKSLEAQVVEYQAIEKK